MKNDLPPMPVPKQTVSKVTLGEFNEKTRIWDCTCACGNPTKKSMAAVRSSQLNGRICACKACTRKYLRKSVHGGSFSASYARAGLDA